MKKFLPIVALVLILLYVTGMFTDFVQLFKNEDGHTKWQYVANWSSGTLIIILSIISIVLYASRKQTHRANVELEQIKEQLEIRVQERTATLDESNRLLKKEVQQHLETSEKLLYSERYLSEILSSMPSMLVGLKADGEVTHWNAKAEIFTGIPAQKAIGFNLWEIYPIMTVTPDQVREALLVDETIQIRQSQRGLFHYDIAIYPIKETGDEGVVLLIDDVTQQVKSENKLIQRDRMSSMGELASSMAIDMNMPLSAIIASIDQLRKHDPSLAESLLGHSNQAQAIINNLLDFAGTSDNTYQLAYLPDIMDNSIKITENMLANGKVLKFSDIRIEKSYEDNIPKIPCHVSEIQQVLISLIRHCYHALSEVDQSLTQPTIKIRMLECYDALWFKVSHNGNGLTGEEQQLIFEPYFSNETKSVAFQVDKRLSFSHYILTEHHNGQMAVTSDESIGTTFHMQLPLG
jgi:PAS domain S-box-containing protein